MKISQTTLYIGGAIFCLSLISAIFFNKSATDAPTKGPAKQPLPGLAIPSLQAGPAQLQPVSKPSPKGAGQTPSAATTEPKFADLNKESIDENLAAIKLTSDGQLVLGTKHKKQLEAAFKRMDYDMSDVQLEKLQKYIQAGLGGEVGEKVATVVRNYYDFKVAERDIMVQAGGASMDNLQSDFEQIVQTRIAFLGTEVNEQLFGDEQRKEQYLIDSMLLQNDTSLSKQEREQRQKQLRKRFQNKNH